MGICGSAMGLEIARSRELEATLAAAQEKERQVIKLLLLGAGESGKSTIFKQMRILYGKGFSEDDRRAFVPVVHSNVLASIRTLMHHASEWGVHIAAREAAALVRSLPDDPAYVTFDGRLAGAIAALWADPGIQQVYASRARFQLIDSAAYYLSKVGEVAAPGYVPSVEDVLKTRVRTSGILEESYEIDGVEFRMVDVGGQRNERRKWIHAFEGVTAVIFVAAISEYDQVLYEDAGVNRVCEALDLFNEIVASKWFESSAIILFLNKRDVFEEKLRRGVELRSDGSGPDGGPPRFLDYGGGCDPEAARRYLLGKFLESARRDRMVYHHVTCATDTDNVRVVFSACKDVILQENVRSAGLEWPKPAPLPQPASSLPHAATASSSAAASSSHAPPPPPPLTGAGAAQQLGAY